MADSQTLRTFCWSELGTADARAAKDFYGRVFGWTFADEDMGELGTYTKIRLGEHEIGGLYELSGPMFEGVPPHWTYYVSTEDVDATASRAAELGAEIDMPPMDVHDAGRMAAITDPTGAKLALFQPRGHRGTTADPFAPGAFGWVELQTRDPARAKAFYTDLFGWHAKDDPSGHYTEWHLPGAQPFGGLIAMDERWGDAPPAWLGYVMVEDCDATFARVTDAGGRGLVGPHDIEHVGRFAVVADPQGAVLAFIRLAADHA